MRSLRAAPAAAFFCLLLLFGCATSTEPVVDPAINERWMSEDVDPLVRSLEAENREIWTNRVQLAAAVAPPPGSTVADVGAGSGFMAREFAQQVGPAGHVYAVDINPALLDHIAEQARADGVDTIETVLCTQRSANLPPASVDLVFICDTYHHFEHPAETMATIHEALRPGGQLVLVEFDRVPGRSRPFVMQHVRGGQDAFTKEIEQFGFELIERVDVPQLRENYVLRFGRRP